MLLNRKGVNDSTLCTYHVCLLPLWLLIFFFFLASSLLPLHCIYYCTGFDSQFIWKLVLSILWKEERKIKNNRFASIHRLKWIFFPLHSISLTNCFKIEDEKRRKIKMIVFLKSSKQLINQSSTEGNFSIRKVIMFDVQKILSLWKIIILPKLTNGLKWIKK